MVSQTNEKALVIEIDKKELKSGVYTVELKGEKVFIGKIIIE